MATAATATPAAAVTTLKVDLSTTLGPVTHAASGSLYGVLETQPADVMGLIAPLHPRVLNNPAADVQQPVGDAIVVAGRVAPLGAMVSIRLADWFTGFYTFTTMADWFNKIGQTVSRKQAAGLTNIYGYEIWNEPNGTYASTNPLPFNQFWQQTFAQLRQLDPGEKLIGPSISFLDLNFMQNFLSFCQANACLPDIVGWHELEGADLTGDIQNYRALEKRLGIAPLPISINEYSGAGHINVEGQPGASAPLIAKFERFRVDSACISFWDVAHPGRLGSLLATNTATNGGWWFYKWYGDMSGNMVSTTPPTPSSPTALDGFANLNAVGGTASVLFGGTTDGSVQVVITGVHAAPFFGPTVHAVVEHTPFVNRTTAVAATDTLSTADLVVSNDTITVTVAGVNATDGYRVLITPTGDGGATTGRDGGPGRGEGGTGPADGGAVTDAAAGTGRGDASSVRDAQAVTDAQGVRDATAESSDGAQGRGAEDGGGSGIDAATASSGDGSAAEKKGQGSAGGCSCQVGKRLPGSAGWGLVGMVPLLRLVRRRRARAR